MRFPGVRQYTVGMTFRVILERDSETGDYSAVCPDLPGCASAGETEEEARANIREAIQLYLAPGDIDLPKNAKLVEVNAHHRGRILHSESRFRMVFVTARFPACLLCQ